MTVDLSATIAPKSDQLNADDLIAGPRTIRVTKVALRSEDQPVSINFEGDDGKPYKPCKSMRRVLVLAWGSDGAAYAGRSMTLYRDEEVAFGGQKVGGIRISHMSHIDRALTMSLTVTRAQRRPYQVKPLQTQQQAQRQGAPAEIPVALKTDAEAAAAGGSERYQEFFTGLSNTDKRVILPLHESLKAKAARADASGFAGGAAEHPALAEMRQHTEVKALVAWYNQLDPETADAIWPAYEAFRDQLVGG